jgi:hypothetical protein
MLKNILSIKSHPDFFGGKKARTRQRVFDLGEHWYSGMPGCDWRTNYWVKRIEKGKRWELYSSTEDALRSRQYAGTFTPTELREEFDAVGFELDEEVWQSLGLGLKAEVIDITDPEAAYG